MNQDGVPGNRTGSCLAVDDGGALARGVEGVSRGYWVGRSEPVLVGRKKNKNFRMIYASKSYMPVRNDLKM